MTSNQNAIDTVTVAGGDSAFREVLGTPVYQKRKIYTRLDSCCCSSSLWGQVSTMTFGLLRQGWLVTEAQVCFSWVYKKNDTKPPPRPRQDQWLSRWHLNSGHGVQGGVWMGEATWVQSLLHLLNPQQSLFHWFYIPMFREWWHMQFASTLKIIHQFNKYLWGTVNS